MKKFLIICFCIIAIMTMALPAFADEDGNIIIFEAVPPTPTPMPIPAPPTPLPQVIQYSHDSAEVEALARWFYGSCYKTGDLDGKRQGAWHLWNRVIDDSGIFPDTLIGVITQRGEYSFYDRHDDITHENRMLAIEMLNRFQMEKHGQPCGRTLPVGYVYQSVNAAHNGYHYMKSVGGQAF